MDAEMLKVITDSYDMQIRVLQQQVSSGMETIRNMEIASVCLSHGGHELEKKGQHGMKYTQCKHCNHIIEDDN